MPRDRHPHLQLVQLVLFELIALALLRRVESVPWTSPSWRGWFYWLESTPPEDVVVELAWLLALVVSVWLTLTTVALLVATALRWRPAMSALARVTAGPVRRTVGGALATLLVGSSVIGGGAVAGAYDGRSATQLEQPYTPTPAGDDYPPPPAAQAGPDRYTVSPGDNFWVIARRSLRDNGHTPDANAVRRYWVDLVDRNRTRIRSGDPNLIFPGEQLERPDSPPASGASDE